MDVTNEAELDAMARVRRLDRVRRLLATARGQSWMRGRVLLFLQLALIVAWSFFVGGGHRDQFVPLVLVVVIAGAAVEESLGRRVDAVLDLLDMAGVLDPERVAAHGGEPR